jgi:hypothetical protein
VSHKVNHLSVDKFTDNDLSPVQGDDASLSPRISDWFRHAVILDVVHDDPEPMTTCRTSKRLTEVMLPLLAWMRAPHLGQ